MSQHSPAAGEEHGDGGKEPGEKQLQAPGIAEKQCQDDRGVLTCSAKKCTTCLEEVNIITTSYFFTFL